MKTIYVKNPDGYLRSVFEKCFPDYRGKKFEVQVGLPKQLNSYWDGGSKRDYVLYDLDTGKLIGVQSNHPFFEPNNPRDLIDPPESIAVVCHKIFCGKDMGLTLYIHPNRFTKLLPAPVELSDHERIVLKYTSGLKSSYAGISNYRFVEANRNTGISHEQWESAKRLCIEKGLLNRAGAITPDGRNQIER